MGLVVGILWVVVGVAYIVYKVGQEGLEGGPVGGIGCLLAVALVIALICYLPDLAACLLIACPFVLIWLGICQYKRQELIRQERAEISAIRNDLPMPNRYQMARFIDEIRFIDDPSKQQLEYREMLRKFEANMTATPLDVKHFKDMQAAWVYYSKNDSHSEERKRIFGEQGLSSKTFFDPAIYRSDETKAVDHLKIFAEAVKLLPTKISMQWCNQPKFARKVFRMIDESASLTEETLYPLMLDSYVKSSDWSLHWMQEEINAVWISLLPKVTYVLSNTAMTAKEEKEWLKIEDFQVACLPVISEKRLLKNEEVFSILLRIYNCLLDKEFAHQPPRYNFALLWNGLNSVGKAIGKNASFFDYPKYIIESDKEANNDHQ